MHNTYDIAVIGGGASGLVAGISAGLYGDIKIAIIEKQQRVGKKILSTGNGRCNLSNTNISPEYYNGDNGFLDLTSDCMSSQELFSSLGLATKADENGRIYPHSMAASSVLDTLRFKAEACCDIYCLFSVNSVIKNKNGLFEIKSDSDIILSKAVIVATGGLATASLGNTGDGYNISKAFGHSIIDVYPALAPVRTDVNLVKSVKGLRTAAKATLIINGKEDISQTGEVQFSDGALSGICIFNMSYKAAKYKGNSEISLDIAPDYDRKQLFEVISTAKELRQSLPCEELLTCLIHKRIGQTILKSAKISFEKKCEDITAKNISLICDIIKDWRFPVTGASDWSLAQVTAGGIPLNEVDSDLQSKYTEGLFFCGEILNINGNCGGFNLDFAWKSGYIAGERSAEYVRNL